jgi:hypothetical protein
VLDHDRASHGFRSRVYNPAHVLPDLKQILDPALQGQRSHTDRRSGPMPPAMSIAFQILSMLIASRHEDQEWQI